MDGKKITQTRITALLNELRSWEQDESRRTVYELSKMFRLEVWVVLSIAKSEDVELEMGERLAGEEISIGEPGEEEGVPTATDPDAITGVYRQNPSTGEFERIEEVED